MVIALSLRFRAMWYLPQPVRRIPKRKTQLEVKKPSKRVIFVTGCKKPTPHQLKALHAALDLAIERKCVLVTTDRDGIDAEVVRYTNTAKYEKVVVWGASGVCRYASNFGHNEIAMYMDAQRNDVCVAKTGTLIAFG